VVAPVVEPAPVLPVEAPAPVVGLTLEQRAQKLGFARHLPQDTEGFISFHNGAKAAEAIQNSKAWALLQENMGFGGGMDFDEMEEMEFPPDMDEDFAIPEEGEQDDDDETGFDRAIDAGGDEMDEMDEDAGVIIGEADLEVMGDEDGFGMEGEFGEPAGPGVLLGSEFGIALGKSGGEQVANLLTGYGRISFMQIRAMTRAMVAVAKTGDIDMMSELMFEHSMNQWPEFLNDPESGVALIERFQIPPLYVSYKVDAENREVAAQEIASTVEFMGMFEEMVEPVEFERAGATFAGYRLLGENIAASMEESREDMDLDLDVDEEVMDRLIAALATKNLVVASGVLGDYVVMFIGASVEDCALVEDLESSLVNSEALKYVDPLLDQELACLVHGDQATIKLMMDASGGLAEMTDAVREGISGEDGLENTRDLESMLQIVAEREAVLRKMISIETFGMVGFYDQGIKFETFGGVDDGSADWEAASKLSTLGDSEDVVLFASMSVDAAYDAASRAYLEALVETTYALTMKLSEYEIEGGQIEKAREMIGLFDEKFRPELATMWRSLSGEFSESLGSEKAMVMDLKGSMPAFKGVPQPVVDTARFMRMSMISPVEDRAKLAASWEPMNASATRLMASVSEILEDDIPMPKPMRSVEDGYTTWFFSLPFTDEDFIPCVTVGDDWFVASSSRLHSMELIAKANAVPEAEERTGVWFKMNFAALQEFAVETMKVLEENAEAIFGAESEALEKFEEQKETINKVIAALEDLDQLTAHSRREGGVLRSTIHFKTR